MTENIHSSSQAEANEISLAFLLRLHMISYIHNVNYEQVGLLQFIELHSFYGSIVYSFALNRNVFNCT